MSKLRRRTFVKAAAALPIAVSAAGMEGCARSAGQAGGPLAPELLHSVGEAVLPRELSADGMERAIARFQQWLREYTPGAELLHGYGTGEIRRAPDDPTGRWNDDLAALETQARTQASVAFVDLDVATRQAVIRSAIADDRLNRLRDPAGARHVVVGLLAHFYETPDAANLCYRAAIDPFACRPLADAANRPVPQP